jgi:hypothetical protein
MNQSIFNPWAAPYLNGYNNTSPSGCEDVDAAYVWPEHNGFQVLTANQQLSVAIVLDQGDDFIYQAFQWSLEPDEEHAVLPGFLYRIQDDAGNFISDGFIYSFCTPGTFANPWPQFPHVTYASHQRLQFEIINLAAFNQGVQLVFRGQKRYRGI